MNRSDLSRALSIAAKAARAAGALMRRHLATPKRVNEISQHDIKLELDVRCQKLIERMLRTTFPAVAILGEEGMWGDTHADARWVVDPIDGTVNFAYGIPHACVSIALQLKSTKRARCKLGIDYPDAYETVVGVVYDPFLDELWTATRSQPSHLNGKPIRVSSRKRLSETIIAMGFAKYRETLVATIPVLNQLVHRVRKVRILGAAALSMVWVANGRMDAYRERGVRLWDIAAGGLIVERAGGEFWRRAVEGEHSYEIIAHNGKLRRQILAAG